MGFFHNEAKAAPRPAKRPVTRSRDIPIQSLNELGCSVCPRDKDKGLKTPKMGPDGASAPIVYVLAAAPSLRGDASGRWDHGVAEQALTRCISRDNLRFVRFGGVIQCASDTVVVGQHEMECCRGRVVSDIEATKPVVILGVGDAPLGWATGLDAYAPKFRGQLISVKVGKHVCWYYPVAYPNWAFKESKYGPSDNETVFKHDMRQLFDMLPDLEEPPEHYTKGFSDGIECILGTDPGDFGRLERALADMCDPDRVGLDLETSGLRPWSKDPLVVTAAVGTFERTVAFAIDHPAGWGTEHQQRRVWSLFTEWLISSRTKECHNLAFEMEWLGWKIDPRVLRLTEWDDTMSMAHTLDERSGTKSLDVQTAIHFGFNLKTKSRIDVSRPQWWLYYDLKDILVYNGMDTKWTNKLSRKLRPLIARDPKMQWAHDRKVRLASTLVITELRGLPVDQAYASKLEGEFEGKTKAIEAKIQRCPEVVTYTKKYGTFSPTNTDHVLALLQKVCHREEVVVSGRDGVKLSTNEEVLATIPADEVPSAALVLEHRGLEKILSTYIRPITTGKIISSDGMIHAKYSSMRAETARLAAEDPNAQNWPKRKHREVRGVVAARDGRWVLAADYGQIEFRVAGMASGDENLVKYCWTGYDVHSYWAKRMVEEYGPTKDWIVEEFDVDWDEKGMKTLRQEAKNKWVFPSIFGASVRSRGANLHLPDDVASALDREFWDEFRGVKKWQERTLKFYDKHLYVETLGGNRRHGPLSQNQIINMPIQGTAAEIVTEGMVAISERALIEDDMNIHPMLNVHDDLSYEPVDEGLEERIDAIVREMCLPRFDWINVPLIVEVSLGQRWSELKEIGVYRSDVLFGHRNPYKD